MTSVHASREWYWWEIQERVLQPSAALIDRRKHPWVREETEQDKDAWWLLVTSIHASSREWVLRLVGDPKGAAAKRSFDRSKEASMSTIRNRTRQRRMMASSDIHTCLHGMSFEIGVGDSRKGVAAQRGFDRSKEASVRTEETDQNNNKTQDGFYIVTSIHTCLQGWIFFWDWCGRSERCCGAKRGFDRSIDVWWVSSRRGNHKRRGIYSNTTQHTQHTHTHTHTHTHVIQTFTTRLIYRKTFFFYNHYVHIM